MALAFEIAHQILKVCHESCVLVGGQFFYPCKDLINRAGLQFFLDLKEHEFVGVAGCELLLEGAVVVRVLLIELLQFVYLLDVQLHIMLHLCVHNFLLTIFGQECIELIDDFLVICAEHLILCLSFCLLTLQLLDSLSQRPVLSL